MPRCSSLCRLLVVVALMVPFLALLGFSAAQDSKGKKYALLVGIRAYDHDSLPDLKHTEADVEELGKVLSVADYRVTLLTTTRGKKPDAAPTAKNIRGKLKNILDHVTKHDTVLVALAGHGVQLRVETAGKEKEVAFFCPADAKPRTTKDAKRLSETLIGLDELFRDLEDSGAGVKLLLVDACRNNPREGRNVDVDALPRPPRGTAALFSCKSGERAFESDRLGVKGHGVFFYRVLEALKGKARNGKGEVTWSSLADYVIDKVSDDVPVLIGGGARQTPHEIRNLTGRSPVLVDRGVVVKDDWGKEFTNSIGMKLVRIPSGKFVMGSPKEEQDAAFQNLDRIRPSERFDPLLYRPEGPQHPVEITKDFWLGVHEVTQEQFQEVMGYNPSFFSRGGKGRRGLTYQDASKPAGGRERVPEDTHDFPVENVSWTEAKQFCESLSELPSEKRRGRSYRLPTEAEWERACRAGDPSYHPFHFGDRLSSRQANFNGTRPYGSAAVGPYLERTCKVGSYERNRFGLLDMHGNVHEWCSDWFSTGSYAESSQKDPQGPATGSTRVFRGGYWFDAGLSCRSAHRFGYAPSHRSYGVGFRVVVVPAAR
jgi:formylglycine-generating enzyme required for sulfatase activity